MKQRHALQAITTKYLGATNHRSERVKARCAGGSLTASWDYEISSFANHREAALALANTLQWPGPWVGGQAYDGSYVFVHPVEEVE